MIERSSDTVNVFDTRVKGRKRRVDFDVMTRTYAPSVAAPRLFFGRAWLYCDDPA